MFYDLLMNYNNYRNRIYKKENTVTAYNSASEGHILGVDKSYNFSLNDGVIMEHVFNVEPFNGEPDYLLLIEEEDNYPIHSRWFVIDWIKIRGNQYKGLLRRDLLADNYEAISKAPSFIEKGFVPSSDSAIFNKEDMTFNQIKSGETLLKDDAHTAWIVGYVAKDHSALSNKTFTVKPDVDIVIASNFSDWTYYALVDGNEHTTLNPYSNNNQMRFVLDAAPGNNKYEFMFNGISGSNYMNLGLLDWWEVNSTDLYNYRTSNWYSGINWTTCLEKVLLDNPSWTSRSDFDYLQSIVGKKIQFNDGVYQLSLSQNTDVLQDDWVYWNSGNIYNYLYGVVNTALPNGIQDVRRYPVAYKLYNKKFRFTATQVPNIQGTYKYSIPQTVQGLSDAPYKMFAIPYYTGDKYFVFSLDGSTYRTIYKDLMMSWAMSIAKEFGANLYDLQLLPYCPLSMWRGLISSARDGIWSIDKVENTDYTTLLDSNNNIVGYCSWCDVSSKEDYLTYPIVVSDYKVENECDMYRLCSPNYASAFEFNPAKNDGVEGYNVRFTYKPYQPFICVAPKFSRLYGNDYKDNRGLILSGDFSLPIVTDAWINYQLQNKNYQLAFDRQIENLEVNYKWQRGMGIANAITGTLQGGTTGAMAGGMMGGPTGAIVGGVVGTVGSAVGGGLDLAMQESLHNEAIDFAKDNFGYQLRNIQALPNTLNKVSSIIAISKLFPFVEKYTCTDEEKEALRNKITYNGMTIGRIGKMEDYINPTNTTFVQGQLIRLDGKFDTHVANEIANEFKKGWYI